MNDCSLFDNEVSQHLVILCIRLLIVHLIVVAGKAVEHEKVTHVVYGNGWDC